MYSVPYMHGTYPTIHVDQNVPFSLMAFMLSRLFSTLFGSDADADPDPNPDPHVFGPPRSGSTSQEVWIWILLSSCKNSKKNLDTYYFVTLFDFLTLKNYVNVASKSNKQKNCVKK
jgi:hypothetical protein